MQERRRSPTNAVYGEDTHVRVSVRISDLRGRVVRVTDGRGVRGHVGLTRTEHHVTDEHVGKREGLGRCRARYALWGAVGALGREVNTPGDVLDERSPRRWDVQSTQRSHGAPWPKAQQQSYDQKPKYINKIWSDTLHDHSSPLPRQQSSQPPSFNRYMAIESSPPPPAAHQTVRQQAEHRTEFVSNLLHSMKHPAYMKNFNQNRTPSKSQLLAPYRESMGDSTYYPTVTEPSPERMVADPVRPMSPAKWTDIIGSAPIAQQRTLTQSVASSWVPPTATIYNAPFVGNPIRPEDIVQPPPSRSVSRSSTVSRSDGWSQRAPSASRSESRASPPPIARAHPVSPPRAGTSFVRIPANVSAGNQYLLDLVRALDGN